MVSWPKNRQPKFFAALQQWPSMDYASGTLIYLASTVAAKDLQVTAPGRRNFFGSDREQISRAILRVRNDSTV